MVEHKKTFYLKDGKTFEDLKGFAKELMKVSSETFEHHVNRGKNDFSKWLKHSMGQDKLADEIEKRFEKLEMELEVLRHIVHVDSKALTKKITKKVSTKKKIVSKSGKNSKKVAKK